MKRENTVALRVWGDLACFTSPEEKTERYSYPIITPSAARGVLEAIFWEPEMYYLIDTIHVVKCGRRLSFLRNEVKNKVNRKSLLKWVDSPKLVKPIVAGAGRGTQRITSALRDVEYIITAEIRLSDLADRSRCNIKKYMELFRRRASSGKCYFSPCLGCREFIADFDFVEDAEEAFAKSGAVSLPESKKPEKMLYDVFDIRQFQKGFKWLTPEELSVARDSFEATLSNCGKQKAKKAMKEYDADPSNRYAGKMIVPKPYFFRPKYDGNVMYCHPDDVEILFAN